MAVSKYYVRTRQHGRPDACKQQAQLAPGAPWSATVLKVARRASLATALLLAPAITLGLYTPSAHGQASASSDAVGKITDTTGATIPGATVHIINNGNGAERVVTTNDSGDFSAPNLPPANYRIRVEKSGFKTSQIPSIDVEIGKTANATLTLSVGGTNEVIEVTTLAPQLQTAEATVGQVIDQKQINDLPLNGRNVLQLAQLAPGVSAAQTGQTGSPGRFGTRSLFITVDGGRGSSTNYVLDGTYVRSVRFNNMSLQPNVDTLQEFNLLRNSFSTEYGQGQAVVSMVTKSGSNSFHGTGYEFARNSIFDARNYFSTVASFPDKPSFTRHQFGGTLGGPIVKDKLFIFAGYEGLRTNRATPVFGNYPTQAQLTTLQPGIAALSQLAKVVGPLFPATQTTNGAPLLVGGNNYAAVPTMTDNYDEYTIRADQTLSQRNTLFERYIDFNSVQFLPSVQGGINNKLIGRNGVIGSTFLVTPNIVNEIRLGYNEYFNFELGVGLNPGTNYAAAEGLQNVTGLTDPTQYGRANVSITGFTNAFDNVTNQGGNENIISVGDSVSFVHGRNTYKAGFQGQNRRVVLLADNNATGSFTFGASSDINPATGVGYTPLQNFQRGFCTSGCNGNFGTTRGHYRDNTYGAFISDVWQAGHGITINAGLRWEYNAPFVEQNGLEGSLDPASGQIKYSKIPTVLPPAFLMAGVINTTSTYNPGIIKPNKKGFGPRLGIAYEARPGTVFRAGGGVYFDNINTNELQFTRYAAPLYYQQSLSNVFVSGLFPNPTNVQPTAQGLPTPFSVLPTNSTPYTFEYNASLQQDMGHGLIVELAYTGSATHKLWKRFDQNEDPLVPGLIAPGVSNTTGASPAVGVGPQTRPFPKFQHGILTSSTEASASFQGGSVKVEKRNKNGLYFLGSYQWSKNLDNGSGEVESNDTAYSTNFAFDRSYARFDVRNRSAISGGYELPFGKGHAYLQKGIGNVLAGGWSVQPAIQLRGGYPFSPSRSGVTFGTYTPGRVNLAPGRTLQSAFLSQRSPAAWFDPTAFVNPGSTVQGNVTRNTLRGPGTRQVDLSAIKNFQIVERVRAQFRAEAYNIINTGIFSAPAANISTTGTVGKISSTSGDNRSIQLAIKVIF